MDLARNRPSTYRTVFRWNWKPWCWRRVWEQNSPTHLRPMPDLLLLPLGHPSPMPPWFLLPPELHQRHVLPERHFFLNHWRNDLHALRCGHLHLYNWLYVVSALPGGHYCPAGTSSWARLNCGRGNYCPDGSGAPTPCPLQVPPTGGWGAMQDQGPAFLEETARCLNQCFWNFTPGDGLIADRTLMAGAGTRCAGLPGLACLGRPAPCALRPAQQLGLRTAHSLCRGVFNWNATPAPNERPPRARIL